MGKVFDVEEIGGLACSTTFVVYDDDGGAVEFWWRELPHLRKLLDQLEKEHKNG